MAKIRSVVDEVKHLNEHHGHAEKHSEVKKHGH